MHQIRYNGTVCFQTFIWYSRLGYNNVRLIFLHKQISVTIDPSLCLEEPLPYFFQTLPKDIHVQSSQETQSPSLSQRITVYNDQYEHSE